LLFEFQGFESIVKNLDLMTNLLDKSNKRLFSW